MELKNIKSKIEKCGGESINQDWEMEINSAFHEDCGLFLDSEFFEIVGVKNKSEVLSLIDMLIKKVEEM